MKQPAIVAISLLIILAGCAHRSGVGQSPSQPAATPAAVSTGSSASTDDSRASPSGDLQAIIQGLGAPIPFDQAFTVVQGVPRFKDEFETAAQFEQRQAAARAQCKERYLIATPVNPEHTRYDADKQVLLVSIYALQNTRAADEMVDFGALFQYDSELSKAGVKIKYGTITFNNVYWAFPRDRRSLGQYDGQNAFGVKVTIFVVDETARGLFERQASRGEYDPDGENLWFRRQPKYVKESQPVAFEIKADPDKARILKQVGGLRAAVLVAPRFPFYATGVDRSTPTIRDPFYTTTSVQYILGDIQGVALYDASGQLIGTRSTQ